MINKTEKEIMQNWQDQEMVVSITCVTFNHENYLHDTLDGFLMQETLFPFEILINDDASTDDTEAILKEYEEKYPNIVKPVYQSVNQYSQGINTMSILFPYITGKYVAFCDGDDYWIDKKKLQIQVDEMQKYPEIDLCFHPSYRDVNGKMIEILSKHSKKNTIFPIKNSILGHGDFAETASMMFTSRLILSLPTWFKSAMPGDYVSEIMGAERGGSLYINRIMSVYRSGLSEGWTETELKKSSAERLQSINNIADQLNFLDEYLGRKYHDEFNQVIHKDRFDFITMVINDIDVKKELYLQHKNDFSFVEKMKWHLLFKHQKLIEGLKKYKTSVSYLFKVKREVRKPVI